jgi:CheY-like chemotaxis protein
MSAPTESPQGIGIVLCDDMIFASRITGTARDLGFVVKAVRSAETLQKLAQEQNPPCVIVDLANPGLNIAETVSFLRQTCIPAPRVVAYGSHVDVETLRRAREAGCDPVLPRSKFVEDLPRALAGWMKVQ